MRIRSRKLCVAFITQLINANSATWYSNGVFGASNSETTIFNRYLVSFRFYREKNTTTTIRTINTNLVEL